MPYHIKKVGSKWCVYNKDTGENKGCSVSEEKAKAHMAALYAHEKKDAVQLVYVATTQPIKSVEGAPNRYRAHAIMFGEPGQRDLYNQYFTKDTDFCLDWYATRPWLYHHGLHPKMGPIKIGTWDTIGVDDEGVFIEGEREEHHKYSAAVDVLLGEGILYPSSGALAYLVDVDETGWIKRWPIAEISSTVSPAEYRMESISPVAQRAIRELDGGSSMNGLQKLFLKLADAVGEVELDDADQAPDLDATTGGTDDAVAGAGEGGGGDATPTLNVDEVATALLSTDQFVKHAQTLEQITQAITLLDGQVKSITVTMDELRNAVNAMSKKDAEKVAAALTGGDWFSQLYVASRDAPTQNEPPPDATPAGQGVPLQPGESVLSRLQA